MDENIADWITLYQYMNKTDTQYSRLKPDSTSGYMPEQYVADIEALTQTPPLRPEFSSVDTAPVPIRVSPQGRGSASDWLRNLHRWISSGKSLSLLYLCIALPTVLLISFLVPPMQSADESRHFVRACQIAQGGWLPEIDVATGRGGGVLPVAVAEFVRHWMDTESLRSEQGIQTIRARLGALEREAQNQVPLRQTRFVEFPSAGIYAPALYIPQAIGIRIARSFSSKVYIWFYSARLCNCLVTVLLIFLALRLAPERIFFLLFTAVLPMSLAHIGSISSDASILGLTIFFIALCVRFLHEDNFRIRLGLTLCLFLLVLGKPVHLPLGILLLLPYKRLGWRRTVSFCLMAMGLAAGSYIAWSVLVKPFIALAGESHGQNPSAQMRFIVAHPNLLAGVIGATFKRDAIFLSKEVIGILGWESLPLPVWSYLTIAVLAATAFIVFVLNASKVVLSNLCLCAVAGIGMAVGVLLAAYILWTPPGLSTIIRLQGRYFLPMLPLFALVAPPSSRLSMSSRTVIGAVGCLCLALSSWFTIRTLDHYYFPRSTVLGKNIHELFSEVPNASCSAYIRDEPLSSWLEWVISGTVAEAGPFRVVATTDAGTILSESDPVFTGSDFPYVLLPGSSRSRWRMHIWYLNRDANVRLWLIRANSACRFGPELHFTPVHMPDA